MIAYLIFVLIVSVLLGLIWTASSVLNLVIKVVFITMAVWTVAILWPIILVWVN